MDYIHPVHDGLLVVLGEELGELVLLESNGDAEVAGGPILLYSSSPPAVCPLRP